MGQQDDRKAEPSASADVEDVDAAGELQASETAVALSPTSEESRAASGPAHLGSAKYVHAAFLVAGILVAFLTGNVLGTVWNALAEWPAGVEKLPWLVSYSEDERADLMLVAGLVIGAVAVWRSYRNRQIQAWAEEVASELGKVYWPDKQLVTKGTIVVLMAGTFATIYVGLLDQLWAFATALVYGS